MLGLLRVTSDNSAPPRGQIESNSDSDDTRQFVIAKNSVWHLVAHLLGDYCLFAVAEMHRLRWSRL